jgi:hypothetical protein
MFKKLVLLVFCLVVTVIGLTVAVWEVITFGFLSTDGLWVTLISLTFAALFGADLGWSFYTGEAQQMLRHLGKGSALKDAPGKNSATPK